MSTRPPTPVYSFWAWLILAPPLITAWGGYALAESATDRLLGLAAAIGVHLAVGLVFWIAGRVERRLTGPARWTWIGIVLVALSTVRPWLADRFREWAALDLALPPLTTRIGLNLVGLAIILLIVHLVFTQVERDGQTRRALAAVLERIEQQRVASEVRHASLILEYQRRIADPIRDALDEVDAARPAGDVAAQLMGIANGVVRPLADGAFAMDPEATEYQYRAEQPAAREPRRRAALQRVEPAPPWGPAGLWFALQLPMAMLVLEPLPGVLVAAASAGAIALASWLVQRQRLPTAPWLALTLLIVEYAIIGLAGTAIMVMPDPSRSTVGYWIYGALLVAVAGSALALGGSRRLEYLARDEELVAELLDAKLRANTAHGLLAATTNLLARRLHASIQPDVVAAALQLRIGADDPASVVAELRGRVERVLAAPMLHSSVDAEPEARPERPSPEGLRAAARASEDAWREALEVTSDYDDEVWAWLADHPSRRALIREVCTRGLTNVIRYSRGRHAHLVVAIRDERLVIEIRHTGRLVSRDHRFSALGELAPRVEVAELVQEDGEIVFRVIA